ncbi:hypothetical protein LTR37_012209 [Vermiconidia calcicola]|uniref:Uncharacterized protein n=1 Tax=Vermiconidia calcicola TaxID=1690605 RepID=A0ACC3N1K8_9PEZI|nr:hypothetical protein LTR37_012209 [Vermiconidia calcicola]
MAKYAKSATPFIQTPDATTNPPTPTKYTNISDMINIVVGPIVLSLAVLSVLIAYLQWRHTRRSNNDATVVDNEAGTELQRLPVNGSVLFFHALNETTIRPPMMVSLP